MKVQNAAVRENQSANTSQFQKQRGDISGQTKSEKFLDSSQVNVSSRAQSFQKAKALASDTSVNEKKVATLQKLIDSGQYKIDAQGVADRLVGDHLMFPSDK